MSAKGSFGSSDLWPPFINFCMHPSIFPWYFLVFLNVFPLFFVLLKILLDDWFSQNEFFYENYICVLNYYN